jgi:hypothetical protein
MITNFACAHAERPIAETANDTGSLAHIRLASALIDMECSRAECPPQATSNSGPCAPASGYGDTDRCWPEWYGGVRSEQGVRLLGHSSGVNGLWVQ